jgi:hypothetical protein
MYFPPIETSFEWLWPRPDEADWVEWTLDHINDLIYQAVLAHGGISKCESFGNTLHTCNFCWTEFADPKYLYNLELRKESLRFLWPPNKETLSYSETQETTFQK